MEVRRASFSPQIVCGSREDDGATSTVLRDAVGVRVRTHGMPGGVIREYELAAWSRIRVTRATRRTCVEPLASSISIVPEPLAAPASAGDRKDLGQQSVAFGADLPEPFAERGNLSFQCGDAAVGWCRPFGSGGDHLVQVCGIDHDLFPGGAGSSETLAASRACSAWCHDRIAASIVPPGS
jgi:hypothetical protein